MKTIAALALIMCALMFVSGCTAPGTKGSNPISASFWLNDRGNLTNNDTVHLTIAVDHAKASDMALSNDNQTWSAWQPYTEYPTWKVTSGDGWRTVYLKVRDSSHHVSKVAQYSIKLDMTPPTAKDLSPSKGAIVWYVLPVITMTFSEPLRPWLAANDCPFHITSPNGTGADTNGFRTIGTNMIACNVTKVLRPNIKYTVRFDKDSSEVLDLAGNSAQVSDWSFSTRPASFQLVDKALFHDSRTGVTNVYGVIKNTDNCSYKDVDLEFDFGGSFQNLTINHIITSGAMMPFYLGVADQAGAVKSAKITVGPNYQEGETYTTAVPYNGLTVSNLQSNYVPPPGGYNGGYGLQGDVHNKAGGLTVSPMVLVAFTKVDPATNATSFACTGSAGFSSTLGAGMTTSFKIDLYGDDCDAAHINGYTIYLIGEV